MIYRERPKRAMLYLKDTATHKSGHIYVHTYAYACAVELDCGPGNSDFAKLKYGISIVEMWSLFCSTLLRQTTFQRRVSGQKIRCKVSK